MTAEQGNTDWLDGGELPEDELSQERQKAETDAKNTHRPDVQYGKNLLVVGTPHFLTPEEKLRLEEHVRAADYVCIEWDEIRDNEAKGKKGGYKDHFHVKWNPFAKSELRGDHLHSSIADAFVYAEVKAIMKGKFDDEAKKHGGSADFQSPDGNEFLYIQELCAKYGKPCYFVDKLITHTRHAMMSRAKEWNLVDAFIEESRARSGHMDREVARIAKERFAATGKEEKGLLVVGAAHLEDFEKWARFRK